MSEAENIPNQNGGGSEDTPSTSATVNPPVRPMGGQTPRPVFMPETFTGTGREWSDWSEQFDLAAEVNNWDEALKIKFMSLLLSGRARDMYSGLPTAAKNNYAMLKTAMSRCFEPCDSDDWGRASFTSRRRHPNETAREFGNALRRLANRAYPSADDRTRDMLARDQFILHLATGDFRVSLRAAKPKTLEEAIELSSEMELLRNLEQSHHVTPEAKVMGVSHVKSSSEEQMGILLGVVEGLRQEVVSLQTAVNNMQLTPKAPNPGPYPEPPVGARGPSGGARDRSSGPSSGAASQRYRDNGGGCWECGCNRHIRRDCPYLQGN